MNNTYFIKEATLIDIADAVREKTGSTASIKTNQIANEIRNKLDTATYQMVDGTISYFHDSRATTVRPYAFYDCNNLHTVIVENATSIGTYGFYSCEKLATLYAPKATSVGGSGLVSCIGLSDVTLGITGTLSSNCTVGTYLRNNQNLTKVAFPECPYIQNEALAYCYNLSQVSFPKASVIGTSAFRNNSAMTYAEFPAVTTVSGLAFYSCKALKELRMPECLTVNQSRAFEQCPALETLYLPKCSFFHASGCLVETQALKSVTIGFSTTVSDAFANHPALQYFKASQGVTLATNCLASCTALTSISFPVATTIGQTAFAYDAQLSSFTFPKATTIGIQAFLNCKAIPEINNNYFNMSTVIVGQSAFQGCTGISRVVLSCGGVSLNAFTGCTNLKEIDLTVPSLTVQSAMLSIPITKLTLRGCSTVTSYVFRSCHNLVSLYTTGATNFSLTGTFENCSALTTISMPGCTQISYATFQNCWALSSVYLPAVTIMGRQCFAFCPELTTVDLPALTTFYYSTTASQMAFYSCPKLSYVRLGGVTTMSSMLLQGNTTIKSVKLDNCTTLNANCLRGMTALTSVSLPNVTTVNATVFYQCSALAQISLPKLTTAAAQAFNGCYKLSQFTIPATVSIIQPSTFLNCSALTSLRIEGSTLKTLSATNAFGGTPLSVSTLTGSFGSIYVPSSLYASYIAATNWKTYSARMVSY